MRIHARGNIWSGAAVAAFDTDDEACGWRMIPSLVWRRGVWTRDDARGELLARRIQAGTVMVNDVVSCFGISEAPHGGFKSSGIGRAHGRFGWKRWSG